MCMLRVQSLALPLPLLFLLVVGVVVIFGAVVVRSDGAYFR